MIKLVKPFLFVFLSILIIFACVKEGSGDNESIQERILKAYIEVNYPDAVITASGIYIVDSVPGTGARIGDSAYAYVNYSTRNLEDSYLSYTYDSIAKQLGTYRETNFYGPQVWFVRKDDSLSTGLQEVMRMMKIGGKIKAILPPGALDEVAGDQVYTGDGISQIYDIELDALVLNIKDHQLKLLDNYTNEHYDGLIKPLEEGFYFKQIKHGEYHEDKDTIPDEAVIDIRYIGKLLDGTVFDTNIKDSAIKYKLIEPTAAEPAAQTFIYYKDIEKAMEKNEYVDGFIMAILKMGGYQDRCITFFDSDFGYGAAGNLRDNNGVPAYYPLFFEIWIDDEPTEVN